VHRNEQGRQEQTLRVGAIDAALDLTGAFLYGPQSVYVGSLDQGLIIRVLRPDPNGAAGQQDIHDIGVFGGQLDYIPDACVYVIPPGLRRRALHWDGAGGEGMDESQLEGSPCGRDRGMGSLGIEEVKLERSI
jgi:hypothetical protein